MNIDFIASLEKAEEIDGRFYVSGVASTALDKDQQNDVMTPAALIEMAKSAVGVPIVTSHNHELHDEIGEIIAANFDDNKLFVKAELDRDDPMAVRMFKKIQKAGKVGFSIGANVKRLASNRLDKSVRMTVDSVDWKHLMLTSRPVNKNTFAIALNKALEETEMAAKPKTEADENGHVAPKQDKEVTKTDAPLTATEKESDATVADRVMNHEAPDVPPNKISIDKAGAMFSMDNKASLKSIHDGGNADTKAKVRAMLGDQADDVLGAMDAPAMSDGSEASDDSSPLGVVNKSLEDMKASLKADFDAAKSAMLETIKEELAKAATAKADGVTLNKSLQNNNGIRVGKNFSETFRMNIGG